MFIVKYQTGNMWIITTAWHRNNTFKCNKTS